MDSKLQVIKKAEETNQAASTILNDLDILASKLVRAVNRTGEAITKNTQNIGIRIEKILPQNFTLIVYQANNSSNLMLEKTVDEILTSRQFATITIPEATFRSIPGDGKKDVFAFVFRKPTLFVGNTKMDTDKNTDKGKGVSISYEGRSRTIRSIQEINIIIICKKRVKGRGYRVFTRDV